MSDGMGHVWTEESDLDRLDELEDVIVPRLEAERDAYKAALEEIAGNQSGTLLYVQDLARSVLAGVVSTREKDK